MSDSIVNVTDELFDEQVLESDLPVLVDFWAQWCGPCKMVAPVLEEIAQEYEGRLRIAKVDVEAEEKIATQYAVRSMPTFIIFVNGEAVQSKLGWRSKSDLTAFIDAHI